MMEYHQMNDDEKQKICDWQYTGEYEIYNMPSYDEQKQKGMGLANPARTKNYFSYFDNGRLVGFTNILEEENEVFIGIGVAPELCGKGYGQKILEIVAGICNELYPSKREYLEVRSWNSRAVKCYEKAGFRIDGEPFKQETSIGAGTFYRMVREK